MNLEKITSDTMNNIITLGIDILKKSLYDEMYRDKVNKKAIEILNDVFNKENKKLKNEERLEIIISFNEKENNNRYLSKMYCTKDAISYQENFKEDCEVWTVDKDFIGVYVQLVREEKTEMRGIKFFFTENK